MSQVHLIYENKQWITPLQTVLENRAIPVRLVDITAGCIDLDREPDPGLYYCRMSASAHTRGHAHATALAAAVLAHLERHGCRIINGSRALTLEMSKVHQLCALQEHGIPTPASIAALGSEAIHSAVRSIGLPAIIKPNQGGKGLGVWRVDSQQELASHLKSDQYDPGPDGIVIVQEYIQSRDNSIVRNEFVGGRHLYSTRVSTGGSFELCPADFCDLDRDDTNHPGRPRFDIVPGLVPAHIDGYLALLAQHGIEIAGIEYLVDRSNQIYTYDINVNTNYNSDAEARAALTDGVSSGVEAVADYLEHELRRLNPISNQAS